jgi:biopolymer transport protein ExbB/TolQ
MKTKIIILAVLAMVLSFSFVYAQAEETATEAVAEVQAQGSTGVAGMLVKIVNDSGFWGYLIIAIFIFGLVLSFIRYNQLYMKEKIDAGQVYLKIKGYIRNDQIDEAIKISESFNKTTMGFIYMSGLKGFKDARNSGKSGRSLVDYVQNAFDEANLQTLYKLDANLWWFDTLAQVCTYLGLLGTIWGLIEAFGALANAPEAEKQVRLTQGIEKAIGTTALGLIAAIPLTVIKGTLLSRAQKLIADVDEFSVKTINQLIYLAKE